ncbi:hypothetical protein HA466_0322180 [Hirschfeldia incana]|nr:hypothetical protein HA466_0322180 [Hirschfeldia incana]
MASPPSDPTDSSRDSFTNPETLPPNPNLTQKPTVDQGSETLYLESTQGDLEESDAVDQQPDPSIEESKKEEEDREKKELLKKRKQQEKKLEALLKTLKPIPFVPSKALDFSRHEKLLKTLGIWEFLHLEFDQNIRQDLVANLVAYYSAEDGCSYVSGARVNVNCADLARALKLPKKEDIVITDEEREVLETCESGMFVKDILETWFLLHTDDKETMLKCRKHAEETKLENTDWAALLWFMVEKELKAEPPLGDCLFASHLQLLMRSQIKDLLREESKVDDEDEEDVEFMVKSLKEDCLEVKEEEEDVGAADLATDDCATESKKEETYVEEHMIAEEQQQGPVEENKKEEEWNAGTSHFLPHCDLSIATEGDEENNIEGEPMEMREDEQIEDLEEDKERHEGGFPFFPNGDSLHGDGQEDLMLEDVSHLRYASGLQMHVNSTGGHFLASKVDMHMAMGSGSNTDNKRQIDDENDMSYHNPDSERMRTDEPSWDENPPAFKICLDQVVMWAMKDNTSCAQKDQELAQKDRELAQKDRELAQKDQELAQKDQELAQKDQDLAQKDQELAQKDQDLAQKDQDLAQSVLNQQCLRSELKIKDKQIEDLERSNHSKELMISRLEYELRMLLSAQEWHKKAWIEKKKALAEHMKLCSLRDENPVYKDVKGSGGSVLSNAETEARRGRHDDRSSIERQVEFGSAYFRETLSEKV